MTEIRQLSDKDLQERITIERDALAKLRFNHTIAGLESPKALSEKKLRFRFHALDPLGEELHQYPLLPALLKYPWWLRKPPGKPEKPLEFVPTLPDQP